MHRDALERLAANFNWRTAALVVFEQLTRRPVKPLFLRKHPLGFLLHVIAREDHFALRLHIWPEGQRYEQSPYWPIHNHLFDLTSAVLVGTLENRVYDLRNEILGRPYRVYGVSYGAGESSLRSTDRTVFANLHACDVISGGNCYSIAQGAFHETIVPLTVFTATLALTKDLGGTPEALGDVNGLAEYKYSRSSLSNDETETIVERLTNMLRPNLTSADNT